MRLHYRNRHTASHTRPLRALARAVSHVSCRYLPGVNHVRPIARAPEGEYEYTDAQTIDEQTLVSDETVNPGREKSPDAQEQIDPSRGRRRHSAPQTSGREKRDQDTDDDAVPGRRGRR